MPSLQSIVALTGSKEEDLEATKSYQPLLVKDMLSKCTTFWGFSSLPSVIIVLGRTGVIIVVVMVKYHLITWSFTIP